MLNILRMDLLILKKSLFIYAGFIIFGVLSFVILGNDKLYNFIAELSPFWGIIAFYSLTQMEENQRFSQIFYSLPTSRKTIVRTRFMEIIFLGIFSGILFFLLNFIKDGVADAVVGGLIYFVLINFIGAIYLLIYYLTNKSIFGFLAFFFITGVYIGIGMVLDIDNYIENQLAISNMLKILVPLCAITLNFICQVLSIRFVKMRSY